MPGVESAGITDALPLGRNRTWGSPAKGVTYERGRFPFAFPRVVSDGYIAAMGIPVVAGRDIAASDRLNGEQVMLVNESMARALWPGQDPIGKYVLGPCAKERRVVGVVGDVRHLALEQASGNEMYLPMRQCRDRSSVDLVVRSTLPPGTARRRHPRRAAADRAEPARQRLPNAPADRGQVGLAAPLHGAAARRLCRLRARPRLARHLRLISYSVESAHAGDRHPHGARRVRARRPGAHHRADALARSDRHCARDRRVVAAGRGSLAASCSASRRAIPARSSGWSCCSRSSRSSPAICRRAGRRGSIRWWRCARNDARGAEPGSTAARIV